MNREEKEARLHALREDLEIVRQAMRDIMRGKKQSYGIGTRNASAYSMSLPQLTAREKAILREIADIECEIAGRPRRARIAFRPIF